MKIDLTQFRQTFLQESADHIATMESGLLALRINPADAEILNAVFRSAHSIKGGAGSFRLEPRAFTHGLKACWNGCARGRWRYRGGAEDAAGSVDLLRARLLATRLGSAGAAANQCSRADASRIGTISPRRRKVQP